jgi:hypothetical protein
MTNKKKKSAKEELHVCYGRERQKEMKRKEKRSDHEHHLDFKGHL